MTLRHDGDPVRHREGFLLIVRHVDERDPDLSLKGLQLDLQPLAKLRVERSQWFVKKQHRRVQDERPRERDPLLLPPGKLGRESLLESR